MGDLGNPPRGTSDSPPLHPTANTPLLATNVLLPLLLILLLLLLLLLLPTVSNPPPSLRGWAPFPNPDVSALLRNLRRRERGGQSLCTT